MLKLPESINFSSNDSFRFDGATKAIWAAFFGDFVIFRLLDLILNLVGLLDLDGLFCRSTDFLLIFLDFCWSLIKL